MNAQVQPIEPAAPAIDQPPPTLANSPLRPDPKAVILDGPVVIVTREWFEANEAQLRHITAACINAERASAAREEARAYLRGELDTAARDLDMANARIRDMEEVAKGIAQAFAEALPLYQASVIVDRIDGGKGIDWHGSMLESFLKLVGHWKGAMRVLSELRELKHIKDTLGKTAEYLARQPKAWESADAILSGVEPDNTPASIAMIRQQLADSEASRMALRAEVERLTGELNTPESIDFLKGVMREAAHQRERWGTANNAGKAPEDWAWLIGHLVGKALRGFAHAAVLRDLSEHAAGDFKDVILRNAAKAHDKGIHHLVTSAAALANWHLNASGVNTRMSAGRDFQMEDEPEPIATPAAAAGLTLPDLSAPSAIASWP